MRATVCVGLAVALSVAFGSAAMADGFKNCTTAAKDKWQPASAAEGEARKAGYDVRRSKVEGSCYEVYGVDKSGKLFELFYNPVDLKLMHTKAK